MNEKNEQSRTGRWAVPSLVIAALVALSGLPSALAAEDHPSPWEHLSQLDANQDGTISREEFDQGTSRFPRLDRDGDGVLTEADFEGLEELPHSRPHGRRGFAMEKGMHKGGRPDPEAMAGMVVARMADDDGDGVVADGEWRGFLDSLAADADGTISAESLRAALPERRAPRDGSERFARLSRWLDRDGDDVLEIGDLEAIFAGLDSDGDGSLIGDEMPRFGPPGGPRAH